LNQTEPLDSSREVAPDTWAYRVYYEDTDAGGVVYHSRYLNFFERARTEWLRKCGVNHEVLRHEQGIIFVVIDMDIAWKLPARLDDVVWVSAEAYPVSGVRMGFRQRMIRPHDGKLLAEADVGAAILSVERYRPVRIPSWIREALERSGHAPEQSGKTEE
jgi:acyl-CoA thioester hydrolase